MANQFTRTWWGEKFIDSLEQNMDEGRLKRGRSYAGPNRLLKFDIKDQDITSTIRGNTNPYFGVYKEPKYKIKIKLKPIPDATWKKILKSLSTNAGWLSRLILDEMPDNIETVFKHHKQNLLPTTSSDLISKCSCPDYSNPCKHIAGTYFKVASLIDRDPFLLFQLRGMNKETMHKVLNGSSLGKALLAQQNEEQVSLSDKVAYRYTQPARISTEEIDEINHSDFWGSGQLPERQLIVESDQIVTAPIIRRQGHYPSFWQNNVSFIDSMEQVYQKIIVKNKDCL